MALIKCPECGSEISDKAKNCIKCGCPIAVVSPIGRVRIKMPNNIAVGWAGLLSSRRAVVLDVKRRTLWEGKHGENASFMVNGPTRITIDLGGWANAVQGIVNPHCKYSLVQDMGIHMLATFRLTEVDHIDAD